MAGCRPLDFLKDEVSAGVDGIPLKYAFGSDFPYRDPGVDWRLETNGVDTRPSFAKGGLSTVWVAAILPYRANDISDWPVAEQELSPHYRAVLKFMPLSGAKDLLEQIFPLYSERPQTLELSNQAHSFLRDLAASAHELKRQGILYGASRLAIWGTSSHAPGCCYCGLCIYGCPYGLIYSSSHTPRLLLKHPRFTYLKNLAVDRVAENGEEVTLQAHDVNTRNRIQLHGSRVFLACGALGTTKILLESLEAFNQPVIMQDSCYFLLPLLRFRAVLGASHERLHTLAQVFMEILDSQVCNQTIHLQIYTYNELYSVALEKIFGPAFSLLQIPAKILLERLLLIQGFFPSQYSPAIRAELCRDAKLGFNTRRLHPVVNEYTKSTLKKVVQMLSRNRNYLRAIPIAPLLRLAKPDRSFHSGGTFPMQVSAGRFKSDLYGRPSG